MDQLYAPDRKLASILGDEPRTLNEFVKATLLCAEWCGLWTSEARKIIEGDREFRRAFGRKRVRVADLPDLLRKHLTPVKQTPGISESLRSLAGRKPGPLTGTASPRDLLKHLQDTAPGFLCCRREDEREVPKRAWPVSHSIGRAARDRLLSRLKRLLGTEAAPWIELYGLMNGLGLYRNEREHLGGVTLFPLGRWEQETRTMRRRYRQMFEENFDDSPGTPLGGVAFAEVPRSGNYFTVQVSGRSRGRIFLVDHDGWTTDPVARNLPRFLGQILADPAAFLYSLGCPLRFTDASGEEWIPVRYHAGVRPGPVR